MSSSEARIKILLLEDEAVIREVIHEYLALAGYVVSVAEEGQAAVDLLATEPFDLAVLDIMVPGPSGLEVLAYIREHKPSLPVIMLSALDDEKTQIDAFNLFADDYVTKPFSPILLLKRIGTIMHRRKLTDQQEHAVTESDDAPALVCDAEAYQAFYGGKALDLTVSEFVLLQTLMDRPKQVFNREQLIEAVYQGDYYGSDRVIDSHIKNLRKKLPRAYIKTVIGIGYQFDGSAV